MLSCVGSLSLSLSPRKCAYRNCISETREVDVGAVVVVVVVVVVVDV
jgi:hypothetical protein